MHSYGNIIVLFKSFCMDNGTSLISSPVLHFI